MSPGLTDEAVKVVTVDVDLDAPENARPCQSLEETEYITVRRVPLRTLVRRPVSHSLPLVAACCLMREGGGGGSEWEGGRGGMIRKK